MLFCEKTIAGFKESFAGSDFANAWYNPAACLCWPFCIDEWASKASLRERCR